MNEPCDPVDARSTHGRCEWADPPPFDIVLTDANSRWIPCGQCAGYSLLNTQGNLCPTCEGTGGTNFDRSRLWCLSHNLDVAGALAAVARFSWQKGFDAGSVTSSF